jgi:hypothetical protein
MGSIVTQPTHAEKAGGGVTPVAIVRVTPGLAADGLVIVVTSRAVWDSL